MPTDALSDAKRRLIMPTDALSDANRCHVLQTDVLMKQYFVSTSIYVSLTSYVYRYALLTLSVPRAGASASSATNGADRPLRPPNRRTQRGRHGKCADIMFCFRLCTKT
jgi:hypothetical protein